MNHILVICTRQIGDVLLTTPVVGAARQRWPDAKIDVLGFAGTLGMLRGNPDIHSLIETPPNMGWTGLASFARRLWRQYDWALVAETSDRAHLFGWIAAPRRSGMVPPRSSSNWWKRLLLDHAVVSTGDNGQQHVVTEKLQLLEPWGQHLATPRVAVPPPSSLPTSIETQLRSSPVVVHVPSMWPYKQWPIRHFEEVIRALLDRGEQVVLTGGPGARDRECIAQLSGLAASPALIDATGQLDFSQLVALLRRAALYIGPDTSVSHLAAAAGTPTIAIFGPTNPQRWSPWPAVAGQHPVVFQRRALLQSSGNVTLLQSALPCVPCTRAGCEDHRQSRADCLPAITPDRVIAAAFELLQRPRRGSPTPLAAD